MQQGVDSLKIAYQKRNIEQLDLSIGTENVDGLADHAEQATQHHQAVQVEPKQSTKRQSRMNNASPQTLFRQEHTPAHHMMNFEVTENGGALNTSVMRSTQSDQALAHEASVQMKLAEKAHEQNNAVGHGGKKQPTGRDSLVEEAFPMKKAPGQGAKASASRSSQA